MKKKLLIIARHRPSVLIEKGEYIARYYNPGDVFDEIHLLLTNGDRLDTNQFAEAAGRATLFVHNLPRPDILRTLGWQKLLIRGWVKEGIRLAGEINPALIRVHNNFIEGYLAQKIKRSLGIPYLVSLHHSEWQFKDTLQERIFGLIWNKFEHAPLREADGTIGVYASNYEYAQMLGASNPQLIYNVVSDRIPKKTSYKFSKPPRLITINQQIKSKNPENILRAVQKIDCEYLVVGNGPYHKQLVALAKELGIENRVTFSTGIPNLELTAQLKDFDLHVSHCDVWGMPKSVMEASLAGLPTLINYHPQRPIQEYDETWLLRCANTPEAYCEAIQSLLMDKKLRERYGQAAQKFAKEHFDPVEMEARLATLYRETMRA